MISDLFRGSFFFYFRSRTSPSILHTKHKKISFYWCSGYQTIVNGGLYDVWSRVNEDADCIIRAAEDQPFEGEAVSNSKSDTVALWEPKSHEDKAEDLLQSWRLRTLAKTINEPDDGSETLSGALSPTKTLFSQHFLLLNHSRISGVARWRNDRVFVPLICPAVPNVELMTRNIRQKCKYTYIHDSSRFF